MLSIADPKIGEALRAYRIEMAEKVIKDSYEVVNALL
jgi:hypothetical protein